MVDVGGIGYEVFIPLSSYDKLPAVGQGVRILTHLHIREDAHVLYGFMTATERDLFRLLVNNVSGIGPKIAARILTARDEIDVEAELDLRNIERPYDQVQPELDRWLAATDVVLQAIKRDPEMASDLMDWMIMELRAFEEARIRSN